MPTRGTANGITPNASNFASSVINNIWGCKGAHGPPYRHGVEKAIVSSVEGFDDTISAESVLISLRGLFKNPCSDCLDQPWQGLTEKPENDYG